MAPPRDRPWMLALFLESAGLLLFELALTRVFANVMFAQFAHLAISLALLGVAAGALLVHLVPSIAPPDRLAARLGWLALAAAAGIVLATLLAVRLELTRPTVELVALGTVSRRRSDSAGELTNLGAIALLCPFVALPFACAGASFAAAFQHLRDRVGRLYAADLCGGAAGALALVPALRAVGAPDTAFVAALLLSAAAAVLFLARGDRRGALVAAAAVASLAAVTGVATRGEVLSIRHAAGFDEDRVTEVRWTPLARVSVWEGPTPFDTFITLDTTSRSRVVTDEAHTRAHFQEHIFGLPYGLARSPGKLLLLGAGAGSDVTAARAAGHRDITAVELVGDYFDIVRTRFAAVPGNPYLQQGVRQVEMDGRSAVMQSRERYDLIALTLASIRSYGGLLAQAWDPRLLYTREAYAEYLRHLAPDGLLSIAVGPGVQSYARSALSAVAEAGAREPRRQVALLREVDPMAVNLLLVRPRPFRPDEVAALRALAEERGYEILLDPEGSGGDVEAALGGGRVLTDDRPYGDTPASLLRGAASDDGGASNQIGRVMLAQVALLLGFGVVLLGLPFALRGRRAVGAVAGSGRALAYFGALGYGFMGIELVLIHRLVLFVGHPTYAVTVVVLALLLGSGAGSLTVARLRPERLARARRAALALVITGAALHALLLSPWLEASLLGQAIAARVAIAALSLLPLGFLLGVPLPLGLRLLPPAAGPIVPWCWALNAWTSVLGATLTVFTARLAGYRASLLLALLAYGLAYALARGLSAVGERAPAGPPDMVTVDAA